MNKNDMLAAYSDFTKWCRDNPHLDLNSRPHSHGGPIGDGGYISDEKTRVAFAAWRAAIEADRKRRGEPVKVPSDIELDDLADDFHGYAGNYTRHGYPIPKFNHVGYARALLARYGQPAQPAASAEHFAEVVGGGMVFWRCGTPPDGTKLYTAPVAAQPSVPVCPYPCGWESLHTMATKDGAYLAKSLEVGHLLTDNERSTAIVASIRLIEVCRTMLRGQ